MRASGASLDLELRYNTLHSPPGEEHTRTQRSAPLVRPSLLFGPSGTRGHIIRLIASGSGSEAALPAAYEGIACLPPLRCRIERIRKIEAAPEGKGRAQAGEGAIGVFSISADRSQSSAPLK